MDTRLVLRAQGGDEAAFATITEQVVGRFQRVAFGILRDHHLAADAAQAGLVQVWKKLPRLRDPARFDAWAHKLLVHACYAEAKRARWSEVTHQQGIGAVAPDGSTTVADRDQLERGFRRLTLDQRAVIVLRVYFDLPPDEVAEALGVPVGTVKSRLSRALSSLRAAIEADARPVSTTSAPVEVSR